MVESVAITDAKAIGFLGARRFFFPALKGLPQLNDGSSMCRGYSARLPRVSLACFMTSSIGTIEGGFPCPIGLLRLPMLSYRAIGLGSPGDLFALTDAGFADSQLASALKHHSAVLDAAFEQQKHAGVIGPGLMPEAARTVEGIDALTVVAGAWHAVVLVNDAAILRQSDAARGMHLALALDFPLA